MTEAHERFDPLQEIWRSQETTPLEVDLPRLRTEAERLDAGVRARNRRETRVAIALTGFFLLIAFAEAVATNAVSATGALLVAASMLWVRFAIRRWGPSELSPEDLSRDARSFLTRYRRELARQRQLVLYAWLWYVLPILAGLLLLGLGRALDRGVPIETWLGSVLVLVTAAVTLGVVLLNLAAARDLTRRIVELRSVEEG